MELKEIEEKADELKKEIDALRPINAETEKRIMQKFRLDWNYHSNNIEGNSLTFDETKSFLLHGITAEGKPLKDHLDLKGHNEAILMLDDVIKNHRPLTETFLREIHEIILHEPYDRPAITADGKPTTKRIEIGQYKKTANHVKTVTGEIFYFATPEETPAKMNDLMDWYAKVSADNSEHPLVIAAEFHYKFIRIHPFDDGNGRMARILMNLILMKYGYPPVIVKTGEKTEYFRALKIADGGDESFFVAYIGEQLIHSLNLFLKGAKGESIEDVDDLDKEIAMLKAKLQDEKEKIIYSRTTANLIYDESILPVLNNIFVKLLHFDELFFNKAVTTDSIYHGKNIGFKSSIDKPQEYILAIKRAANGSTIVSKTNFKIVFKEFKKTEHKNFDIAINFEIDFNRYDFTVTLPFGEKQIFKILYHAKNDEKKFQKIATAIAKHVLKEIEEKLSE